MKDVAAGRLHHDRRTKDRTGKDNRLLWGSSLGSNRKTRPELDENGCGCVGAHVAELTGVGISFKEGGSLFGESTVPT